VAKAYIAVVDVYDHTDQIQWDSDACHKILNFTKEYLFSSTLYC